MKKILSVLSIAFLALTSVSCVVDDEAPKKEFTETPYAVGFKSSTKALNVLLTGDVVNHMEPVDLIAGMDNTRSNPAITVDFEIDPSSTATEGVEYTLTGSQVTIEAGKDFGTIPIDINSANIVVGSPKTIVINLLSTSTGIIPARNQKITITLIGICFSDLAGVYDNPDVPTDQATITSIGAGTYSCSGLPFLSSGGSPVPFEFSDICGEITINSVIFGSYLCIGEGVVNPDGSITITYVLHDGLSTSDPILFDFSGDPSTYSPN